MADTDEPSVSGKNSNEIVDESNSVTMLEVLAAEKALEEDANAVLGDSDEKNCTYPQGYIKRQALYACLTCTPPDSGRKAGVCLACSYHCHEDHELVELYTKRNFRCDCGTQVFNGKKCSLLADKPLEPNEKNSYNQNFIGLYCSCNRPYPDPEDDTEDIMIQCIICEDWYHFRHLNTEMNSSTDYSEMICETCVRRNPFLLRYVDLHVNKQEINVDVTSVSPIPNPKSVVANVNNPENLPPNEQTVDKETITGAQVETDDSEKQVEVTTEVEGPISSLDKNLTDGTSSSAESAETIPAVVSNCILPVESNELPKIKTLFFNSDWRKQLCKCNNCSMLYKSEGVEFLTDEGDTVLAYEERGKSKEREGQYEQGLRALSSLDRIQQVEALTEYNELKNNLSEYLKKFVENKKIVREEDIKEFFSGLAERKKRKVEPPPYYCR
nr:PREDICTED: putative E3 ubiquitin-protein ligase UBR7 [Bemisia tabaci]